MRARELAQVIEADDWFMARQRGNHRQLHHRVKPGCVSVPGHLSDEVSKGTLASIMIQAGSKRSGQ